MRMMAKVIFAIILMVCMLPCPPVRHENDGESDFPHHSHGVYAALHHLTVGSTAKARIWGDCKRPEPALPHHPPALEEKN